MDFKQKYLKYKQKYLALRGGTRLMDDTKCDNVDKMLNNYNYCSGITKVDNINATFVFIDSISLGNQLSTSSYLYAFIYHLLKNINLSIDDIHIFTDIYGLYNCLKKINDNISNRTLITLDDVHLIEQNRDYDLIIEKFKSGFCNFERNQQHEQIDEANIFLKIVIDSFKNGNSVLTNAIEPVNKVNIKASFSGFITKVADSDKKNIIMNISCHGDIDKIFISTNPAVALNHLTFYDNLKYLNSNKDLQNLIIVTNHCQAETFYKPLFTKINDANELNFNVILLKSQINLMETNYYKWVHDTLSEYKKTGNYNGSTFDKLVYKTPSGTDIIISSIYAEADFNQLNPKDTDDICGDALGGGIVPIIERFYNQTNTINEEQLKQILFDIWISERRDWSSEIAKVYDGQTHPDIKNQIMDEFVKIYAKRPENLKTNFVEYFWNT